VAIIDGMELNAFVKRNFKSSLAFAERLGVSGPTVHYWMIGRKKPSIDHCKAIEFVSGGEVRCEELRPELNWKYLRGLK